MKIEIGNVNQMKIALVSPYDYPYPGGVTEHVAALDKHFRKLGHDTRIIAASSTDEDVLSDHIIKVSGAILPVSVSGSKARVAYSPQVYQRVKKILHEERFDVVHIHEPTIPMLSLAVLRHSHAINVGTFHAYRETTSAYAYMRPLVKRVLGRLDGRIFVSDAVQESITRYFPGDYVIIPNGIDYARFSSPTTQPIERFNDGRPNILFVGRMEKRKGFRHLIRAFVYIKKEIPDARLIVVGAYEDKEKGPFLRYARTHKLHGVHFVGRVSPEDLPRYYRTATVFCAPSTGFESFGIVLLEAMAAGVPIIASDIPGYRGVLENGRGGLLVPPGDEQTIARAITSLLRDPAKKARMSECGRQTAAEHDWSIIAQRVLDYYALISSKKLAQATRPGKSQFVRLRRSLKAIRL